MEGGARSVLSSTDTMSVDEAFMRAALEQARAAEAAGEVPIGAVLVSDGALLAAGFNQPIRAADPSAHAEIVALRAGAAAAANYRLPGTTLYVTIEPCLMCVGAIVQARIERLVYGADDPKAGAIRSLLRASDLALNHRFAVTPGVLETECREVLVSFFRSRRSGT
jgi:tRNA(adenine34) deaminase